MNQIKWTWINNIGNGDNIEKKYLIEAADERRNAIVEPVVRSAGGRQIGGAVAQVIDGRDAVEQLVLHLAQLERNFFGERQQLLEHVQLLREGRRQRQHPPGHTGGCRRRRLVVGGAVAVQRAAGRRRRGGRGRAGNIVFGVGRIELLLQVPEHGAEVVQRRVRRDHHVPARCAEF